ncbi:glutaredoxin-C9 [Silene latifolia]|uniref:glutaredoxin-C9 n=1 Tax=Silene latifolia TaxID=37657 RepID=UPI003D76F3F9
MHQALPYQTWHKTTSVGLKERPIKISGTRENMKRVVKENAVVVICRRGCCMSHVVTRLLLGLGVNPTVKEIDEEDEVLVRGELERVGSTGGELSFPAVFIGGTWFGGLDRVMATHITGELNPILRQAGALWL